MRTSASPGPGSGTRIVSTLTGAPLAPAITPLTAFAIVVPPEKALLHALCRRSIGKHARRVKPGFAHHHTQSYAVRSLSRCRSGFSRDRRPGSRLKSLLRKGHLGHHSACYAPIHRKLNDPDGPKSMLALG